MGVPSLDVCFSVSSQLQGLLQAHSSQVEDKVRTGFEGLTDPLTLLPYRKGDFYREAL